MFTGIIQAIGKIEKIDALEQGVRLSIDAGALEMDDVALGDSIAANGVCLTVIAKTANGYQVDVSRETLNCTAGLGNAGAEINLEKAMRLSDRLGGHLVSGHVDGVGSVVAFDPVGECFLLRIRAPHDIAKYIAYKGSITVNGVSLTVNSVEHDEFTINLIPHTLEMTTLKHLKAGSPVNLEVDLLARYVDRLNSFANEQI
ncbi:MAG: riboflavin synthase [Betaproteobacteria bacterium]|nr:riboflavin synthase [Betaproteobacteria bacterium]